MHNDGILEVSENILIPKPLMASKNKKPQYQDFLCFFKKNLRFRFFNGNQNGIIQFATLFHRRQTKFDRIRGYEPNAN